MALAIRPHSSSGNAGSQSHHIMEGPNAIQKRISFISFPPPSPSNKTPPRPITSNVKQHHTIIKSSSNHKPKIQHRSLLAHRSRQQMTKHRYSLSAIYLHFQFQFHFIQQIQVATDRHSFFASIPPMNKSNSNNKQITK